MGAAMGRQAVERASLEVHRAGLVVERAADAVDERALARSIRTDQAQALATRNIEIDSLQRDEAAEPLTHGLDFEQGRAHGLAREWRQSSTRPRIPLGAITTKPTNRTPTIKRLTAEEMVTVAICCNDPSRIAPSNGPGQLVVPPIMGMAMELTA